VNRVESNGELLLIDPEETVLRVNETGAEVLKILLAGQGGELAISNVVEQTGCGWTEAEEIIHRLLVGLASRGFLNFEPPSPQN
jgi:DNA-binding IclR family transcriptional regulator